VTRHVPDLDQSKTSERLSENGNFVSISYSIHAKSREQVVALATELSACDEVMMVL
jgi:putative lipoic acid-binding regulatory protein